MTERRPPSQPPGPISRPPASPGGGSAEGVTLADYLAVPWAHRWAILALVALASVAGFVSARLQPPVFEARATVRAAQDVPWAAGSPRAPVQAGGDGQAGPVVLVPPAPPAVRADGWTPTAEAVLRSVVLAEQLLGTPEARADAGGVEPGFFAATAIRVEPLRETPFFRAVLRARSPEGAERLLGRLIQLAADALQAREREGLDARQAAAARDVEAARARLEALLARDTGRAGATAIEALDVRLARQAYADLVFSQAHLTSSGPASSLPRLEIVDPPHADSTRVEPSTRRSVLTAVVPAAALGFIGSFLFEWWRRNRATFSAQRGR